MNIRLLPGVFGSFVRTINRYPIASLFATGLLTWGATVFLIFSLFMSNYTETLVFIDKWFPAPHIETKRLQDSLPRDLRTCRAIDKLGITLNADRATFWAFTNGTLGTGGLPWAWSNVYCPYVSDGIAFLPTEMQRIHNAPLAEINSVLFPPDGPPTCASWTIDSIKSPYIRASMREVGTDIVFQCGVRDINNNVIGKVVVSWRDRASVKDSAAVLKAVEQTASAIGVINSLTLPRDKISETIEKQKP